MNSYLLTFNLDSTPQTDVVSSIDQISEIENWMFFFDNVACLVSKESPRELARLIRKNLPNMQFIIVELEAKKRSGWLRKSVWDFIREPKTVVN